MATLSTTYAQLPLSSPIIVASSGLTNTTTKAKKCEEAGAGAIVIKSIFEEQMEQEVAYMVEGTDYPEAIDYLRHYVSSNEVDKHLDLVRQCRDAVSIPVVASINCYKTDSWVEYADKFAQAGASALELNVMRLESNPRQKADATEQELARLVREVSREVRIPVTVKLSRFLTNVPRVAYDLQEAGASGVVLFNRMYMPDIDIDKEELSVGGLFSSHEEYATGIRFAALVRAAVPQLSIALSTGARDGSDVVKGLLAGADAVQLCTAIYKGGYEVIRRSNDFVRLWMEGKKYQKIEEFKSRLAATSTANANFYQRAQFMKHISSADDRPTNTQEPLRDHPNLPY